MTTLGERPHSGAVPPPWCTRSAPRVARARVVVGVISMAMLRALLRGPLGSFSGSVALTGVVGAGVGAAGCVQAQPLLGVLLLPLLLGVLLLLRETDASGSAAIAAAAPPPLLLMVAGGGGGGGGDCSVLLLGDAISRPLPL